MHAKYQRIRTLMEWKINIHYLSLLLYFIKKSIIALLPAPLLKTQRELGNKEKTEISASLN